MVSVGTRLEVLVPSLDWMLVHTKLPPEHFYQAIKLSSLVLKPGLTQIVSHLTLGDVAFHINYDVCRVDVFSNTVK